MEPWKTVNLRYAISLAASWAWGVSFVVGMQTVQEKGILPFWIWAIANSLSLPLFGCIAYRIPNLSKVVNSKPVQIFMTCIMVFCLWIQMNAIHQTLESIEMFSPTVCTAVPIVFALLLAAVLYWNGLARSILLDNPLWIACYLLLIVIMLCGVVSDVPRYENVLLVSRAEIPWALNSCLILFAGPIMNIQNWQMAEKLKAEHQMSAHTAAGIIFGIYMCLVFMLSFLHFNGAMNVLMIAVILCITITTIDAAIVGMQKIAGRKIGLGMALIAILFWQWFQGIGVLELWTFMGSARLYVAAICICVALVLCVSRKGAEKDFHGQN